MPEMSEYVTLKEACELLGKTGDEVKALAEGKGIRSFRDANIVKFKRADITALAESAAPKEANLEEALKSDDDFLLFTEEEGKPTSDSETLELMPEEKKKSGPLKAPTVGLGARGPETKSDTKAETKGDTKTDLTADTSAELKTDTKSEVESGTDAETGTKADTKVDAGEMDLGEDLFELEPVEEEEDTGTAGVFDELDIIEEEEESGSTEEVTGQMAPGAEEAEETILEGTEALEEGEEVSAEEIQKMAERRIGATGAARLTGHEAPIAVPFVVLLVLGAVACLWAALMAVNQLIPGAGVQGINAILVNLFTKG
jgi:hypothetical protein